MGFFAYSPETMHFYSFDLLHTMSRGSYPFRAMHLIFGATCSANLQDELY